MKIVRRDRYRCRGCDRKGDEVTLEIHQIFPGASEVSEMLALCTNCRAVASAFQLAGTDVPDLLRQLWRHLHHPALHMRARFTFADDEGTARPENQPPAELARAVSLSTNSAMRAGLGARP